MNDWKVLAYCLMGNHFHILVEATAAALEKGMQMLGTRYAIRLRMRHGREGHCFERRYWSRTVETTDYFEYLLGYIALNPVKDGFCSRPEDWSWSSFGPLVSGRETLIDRPRLFERLGDTDDPIARYRACLESPDPETEM